MIFLAKLRWLKSPASTTISRVPISKPTIAIAIVAKAKMDQSNLMAVGKEGSTPPMAAISTARNTHPVTTQMIVKGMVRARLRPSRGDND